MRKNRRHWRALARRLMRRARRRPLSRRMTRLLLTAMLLGGWSGTVPGQWSTTYVGSVTDMDGDRHRGCWEAAWGEDEFLLACSDGFWGP